MMIWIVLTLMCSAAAVLVSAPFLRGERGTAGSPTASGEIAVYRDQLAEVDREVAAGAIDEEQAGSARLEIKRRMLAAAGSDANEGKGLSDIERRFVGAVVAGSVLLVAIIFYANAGSPDIEAASPATTIAGMPAMPSVAAASASRVQQSEAAPAQAGSGLASVDAMIERLVERLKRSPGDVEGWRMLGWSYFSTEHFAEAAEAYGKAATLAPSRSDLRTSQGEAMVRAADGRVGDEAKQVFESALKLDAKDPRSRFFIGLAKEQGGDKIAALEVWLAILDEASPTDEYVADLAARSRELAAELGVDVAKRIAVAPTQTGGILGRLARAGGGAGFGGQVPAVVVEAQPRIGGPTADDVRNAQSLSEDQRVGMVRGMVTGLASRLEKAPRDEEGWIMLIKSRAVMGDMPAAKDDLRRALTVFADAPDTQGRIAGVARELGVFK